MSRIVVPRNFVDTEVKIIWKPATVLRLCEGGVTGRGLLFK